MKILFLDIDYVIAGVSMQETETGCFVFSR